jgi:hypothetical protein
VGGGGGLSFSHHHLQSTSGRAVPGRDIASQHVLEEDVLTDDDNDEEDVVVHKRTGQKRKQ